LRELWQGGAKKPANVARSALLQRGQRVNPIALTPDQFTALVVAQADIWVAVGERAMTTLSTFRTIVPVVTASFHRPDDLDKQLAGPGRSLSACVSMIAM
jgi:hypothetical protein